MSSKSYIDATRLNAFAIEPERLTLIEDPKHHLYDERVHLPVDETMVKNIMVHGVKVPVLVAREGDLVIVVDGRQRVKAALEANKLLKKEGSEPIKIKIFAEKGTEAELFGVCILANEMRQEDGPIVKARKAKRYLDMNPDKKACAVVFGVSAVQVERWLKILDLAQPVLRAIEKGEITATAASELSELSREKQVEELSKLKAAAKEGKKVTTKDAKKAAKKVTASKDGEPTYDRPSLKELKKVYAHADLPSDDKDLVGWVLGLVSAKDAGVDEFLVDPPKVEDTKEASAGADGN